MKNDKGDLISREALLKMARRYKEYDEGGWSMTVMAVPVEAIEEAPAVDAAPVVHGRWKYHPPFASIAGSYLCSACGFLTFASGVIGYNYCPRCGAKMGTDK